MNAYFGCIAALSALSMVSCSSAGEDDWPSSLSSVIGDLKSELGDELSVEQISKTKTFLRIRSHRNELFWGQLVLSHDPAAHIAGLLCFQATNPEQAQIHAARAILSSSRPGAPQLGLAMSIVSERFADKKNAKAIAAMLSYGNADAPNVTSLLTALGTENVSDVFEFIDLEICTAVSVAYIVGEVNGLPKEKRNDALERKIDRAVEMLKGAPGLSRLIFLAVSNPMPANSDDLLESALKDNSIDDSAVLYFLLRRGDQVRDQLARILPKLPSTRQKLVQRYLDRNRN